jgi:hypothetical protein
MSGHYCTSEERLKRIMSYQSHLYCTWDNEGRVMVCESSTEKMIFYVPSMDFAIWLCEAANKEFEKRSKKKQAMTG